MTRLSKNASASKLSFLLGKFEVTPISETLRVIFFGLGVLRPDCLVGIPRSSSLLSLSVFPIINADAAILWKVVAMFEVFAYQIMTPTRFFGRVILFVRGCEHLLRSHDSWLWFCLREDTERCLASWLWSLSSFCA